MDPKQRIAALLGSDITIGGGDEFTYSFSQGYEQLKHRIEDGGSLEYAGAHHPGDGFCHAENTNDVEEMGGDGVCIHCGRTLM